MPVTPPPDTPFLNRLVHAMFEHADPKADQNIWNLARAAEEVMREVKGEQLTAAYGGPGSLAATELTDRQREWQRRNGPVGLMSAEEGQKLSFTGRMRINPVPLTFSKDPAQGYQPPDYAAQLGEVERRFALKAPQYTGDTATKVDALAQDYQAAVQLVDEIKRENTKLMEQLAGAKDVISQLREVLDPDSQFEDESLIVLARERMSSREARRQELIRLQERIGTEIESNSAEMLRRVLGAGENETLGRAARRVAESATTGWEQFRRLNDLQNNEFHKLSTKVREIVGAVDEFESDDHYMPEQPTTDAVRRVVRRLHELSRHPDGSSRSLAEVISEVQEDWEGQEIEPLPGEQTA